MITDVIQLHYDSPWIKSLYLFITYDLNESRCHLTTNGLLETGFDINILSSTLEICPIYCMNYTQQTHSTLLLEEILISKQITNKIFLWLDNIYSSISTGT